MAPIPPILVRLLAGYMTQALTRRLQQSPAFFRMVDRMVHEADHFPLRMQGKPVPPYLPRNPHEPTLREQAQDAWQRQTDDAGEPHDTPDPFRPVSQIQDKQEQQQQQTATASPPSHTRFDPSTQRRRAPPSNTSSHDSTTRPQGSGGGERRKKDAGMDEMRALLDKLREKDKAA